MQLNLGLFEYNARCGLLLKPELLRRRDRTFDPFAEELLDGIVANGLRVQVLSGQFLSERRVGVYVEVDVFGLPVDTRRRFRTRPSSGNPFNPVWDEEPFLFHKVVLPSLASLRVAAYEEGGRLLGQRVLPVTALRSGYHYVCLRNESNQPLCLPALLLHTQACDYVPQGHQDYAEALINPIKHVSLMDQRARRLEALMGDEEGPEKPREPPAGGGTRGDAATDPPPELRPPPTPGAPPPGPPPTSSPGQRDDLIASVLTEVRASGPEELRQHKGLLKLLKRQQRELKELRKKQAKKLVALHKRLVASDKSEEAPGELLQLREEQQREELEVRREQLRQAQQRLREVALEAQAAQIKRLRQTSEREKKELQKILDRKRHNSISEARGGRRGGDLPEINRRHITESVTSIRRLEEAQQRRLEKLLEGHRGVLEQIQEEEPRLLRELELGRPPSAWGGGDRGGAPPNDPPGDTTVL